jgi:hypothetical protein
MCNVEFKLVVSYEKLKLEINLMFVDKALSLEENWKKTITIDNYILVAKDIRYLKLSNYTKKVA